MSRWSSTRSGHRDAARVATGPRVIAVDVTAVLSVVRKWQEREVPRDAVLCNVHADGSGSVRQEVDTVADMVGDVVLASYDTHRDIRHVVVGPASVGPTCFVRAQRRSQPALVLRGSRWHAQVEPQ